MSWLSALFHKKPREQRLDLELLFHLEQQTRENLAAGMSPQEARRRAAIEFGGLDQIKERCRDVQSGRWLETALQDLRFGMRSLCRTRGFAIAALAMIGIGIGANTAIFSFFDAVLLKPVPYPDADRIVQVIEKNSDGWRGNITVLNYLDWAKQNKVFENIAACSWDTVTLTGTDEPAELNQERDSAHIFDIFRVRPALGRTFVDGEDQLGRDRVVVLAHRLWVSRFGADPGVIGHTLTLDGKPNTVIGVMPPDPYDRGWAQIYRPLAFAPEDMSRDWHWLWAYAMLKPGVTIEQARTQMDAIAQRLAHDYPKSNRRLGVAIDAISTTLVSKDLRQSLYLLMAAAGMVLLIGCANLANLTLARGVAREREVAIRAALGAGRGRLVRQFLTESLLLSSLGGALGLLLAYSGMDAMKRAMPPYLLPLTAKVAVDGRVLLFTLALSVVTGVVVGLIPAFRASRPDLTRSIKEGGPGASLGRAFHSFRGALIVAEVALAFMLLSGAGLLIRSFFKLQNAATGFDSTNVLTASLPISVERFASATEFNLYLHHIVDRIGSLPGVRDVALCAALPMQSTGLTMYFQIVGAKEVEMTNRPVCIFRQVTPSYFRALGIKLAEGRLLSDHDVEGSPLVAVITEGMARQFFPNEDPVGKHILVPQFLFAKTQFGPPIPWEVIGVIMDERLGGLRDQLEQDYPAMYVSEDQSPQTHWQSLVIRGAVDPAVLQRSVRHAVSEVNRDQVLDRMKTLDQIKADSMGSDRLRSSLLAIFATVALLLAAVGIYGVISYSVAQRTREIGIRTALGASSKNILGLVLRGGMTLTSLGLIIGIGGALVLSQLLATMLYNIGKYDPTTLVVVGAVLCFTALLACYIPARRATKVNPIVALRCD